MKFPGEPLTMVTTSGAEAKEVVGHHGAGKSAQYVLTPYGGAPSSSSMEHLTFDPSSPWWTGRLIASPPQPMHVTHEEVTQGAILVGDDQVAVVVHVDPGDPSAILYQETNLAIGPRYGLDFGHGVVVPSGAVANPKPEAWTALKEIAFAGVAALHKPAGLEWLAPDSEADIAAATVGDDAEWDEDETGPTWVSLGDVSYRGGGVMGRRRGTSTA
jgi:hypothetical protein